MIATWLQNRIQSRTGWGNQTTLWVILGMIIGLAVAALYLSQVVSFATTNREIEELIQDRDRLERLNEQYLSEIANLTTVPRLLERAESLGFRAATTQQIQYLGVEGYQPQQPNLPSQPEIFQIEIEPDYDETFGGWLQQQLDAIGQQFQSFGE